MPSFCVELNSLYPVLVTVSETTELRVTGVGVAAILAVVLITVVVSLFAVYVLFKFFTRK